MTVYIVLGMLVIATVWNILSERIIPAFIVLIITMMSYTLYYYGPVEYLINSLSYYGYLSIAPLASICLLYFVKSNTSIALMALFSLLLIVHLFFFLMDYIGWDVDEIYQYICWGFFTIEVLILLSERVTNAVLKLCDRVRHSLNLDNHHHHDWPKNSIGAIK